MPDEGLTTLTGFIGEAGTPDRVRVYTDLTFGSYFELEQGAVVRTTQVDSSDPNSPTALWVSRTAEVTYTKVSTTTGAASFMTGSIRNRYGGRRRAGRMAADPVSDLICSVFCIPQTKAPFPTDNPWECSPVSQNCTSDVFCDYTVMACPGTFYECV